jgi:hypothetical protein
MDLVNFRGLTDEDLEASSAAVAEAPPLTAAHIDVISTLMGSHQWMSMSQAARPVV